MSRNRPKVIDLFCGAGGLSYGLELAGFEVILGVDNNSAALETFKTNHKDSEALNIDLSKPPPSELVQDLNDEDLKGIVGGPPCQGFSDARGSRSVKDNRNDLVPRFLEWVDLLRPPFAIMENVAGIATISKGSYFSQVKKNYQKLGYHVEDKIMHAAQYGVPQKRERMILVAVNESSRKGYKLHPEPTHFIPKEMRGISVKVKEAVAQSKRRISLDKWMGGKNGTSQMPKQLGHYTTIEEAFEGLPIETSEEGVVELPSDINSSYIKFIRKGGKVSSTTLHIAKRVRPADLHITQRVPEGKIYRSNRHGERYVPVWVIFAGELTKEEKSVLEYLGRNQTKRGLVLEDKEEGHIPEHLVFRETHVELDVLTGLVKEGWISRKEVNGQVGYKLRSKAGLRPRFMRLNRNSISHTILTVDFDAREKIHPVAHRGLSLREGARLQSFPDDFHFSGTFKEVATQIGNAVPPLLGYKIANHISDVFGLQIQSAVAL